MTIEVSTFEVSEQRVLEVTRQARRCAAGPEWARAPYVMRHCAVMAALADPFPVEQAGEVLGDEALNLLALRVMNAIERPPTHAEDLGDLGYRVSHLLAALMIASFVEYVYVVMAHIPLVWLVPALAWTALLVWAGQSLVLWLSLRRARN